MNCSIGMREAVPLFDLYLFTFVYILWSFSYPSQYSWL